MVGGVAWQNAQEAAKLLGIGVRQMYEALQTKRIASDRIGRRYLIPRKVLDEVFGGPQPKAPEPAAPTEALKVLLEAVPVLRGARESSV